MGQVWIPPPPPAATIIPCEDLPPWALELARAAVDVAAHRKACYLVVSLSADGVWHVRVTNPPERRVRIA